MENHIDTVRRAVGIRKRLNSREKCDNKHFKSQERDNRVVKRQVRAGQPECERKKWPSWLMRAARGVACADKNSDKAHS